LFGESLGPIGTSLVLDPLRYSRSVSTAIVIRPAKPDEMNAVHELVQTIADDTFADLFTAQHVPIGEANWLTAWLAIAANEIVGVMMTREDWLSDLWVCRDRRRHGIGATLLAHAEREIGSRGESECS
jgi:GNAT superfamily N-acetyltransferase